MIKNNLRGYDNIWKIATGQADGYVTGCLLNYLHIKEYHNLIVIDLIKQQKLDDDLKSTRCKRKFWRCKKVQQGFSLFKKRKKQF